MRRALLLTALLTLLLHATASAAPDSWTRWVVPGNLDQGATVRSLDFTAPGVVYAGSEDDGVFVSTNGGFAWAADNAGLEGIAGANNIRQVISNGGNLYVATSIGVFRKPVGGGSWMPLGQGAEPGRLNAPVQFLHFNSGSDIVATVAAQSPGVYRSTDGGEHWAKASGIPSSTSMYFIHSAGGMLFAAGADGVFRSTDGGSSWSLRSDGLPFANAWRMAGDAANLYVATSSGVFRSDNLGETWSARNGFSPTALGNTEAVGMLAAPSGFGGGRLLVSTAQGVWASRDQGLNWGQMSPTSTPASPKFGDLKIWTLGYSPIANPGFLLAGTQGWGSYTMPFQPVTSGNAPTTGAGAIVRVGNKLTGTPGTWNGTRPHFLAFMWMRCPDTNNNNVGQCTETGDTGLTHVVESDDLNKYLRLRVTARGIVPPDPNARFSSPAPVVMAAQGNPPSPPGGSYPRILGPDGQSSLSKSWEWPSEYTVDPGTWNPASTFEYVWLRCKGLNPCTEIPGAVGAKYTSTPDDVGYGLRVEVTGTASNNSTTVYNGPTFEVKERVPVNTEAPRVIGDAFVGSTLDSRSGGWVGRGIKYFRTWQVCEADGTGCNSIINETGPQYTINKIYLGKRLRVRVQVSNADGQQDDREAFSELTPVVTLPPAGPGDPPKQEPPKEEPPKQEPPKGVARPALIRPARLRVGAVLKAPRIPGATKLRYQWLRNGKKIKGAKKRTYRIRRGDRGKRLACRMSFVLAGTSSSVTTKAVRVPRKPR